MSTPPPKSYLIIGSGAFGAPTALALKKAEPHTEITVVDRKPFPCPYGAGHDLNKLCRGDYGDLMYMKLAIKSLDAWSKDPLYSQHFHNSGLLYAYDEAYLKTIIANWEKLYGKGKAPSYLLDPADAKQKFDGIYRDANWDMATQSLWSPTAGWADSAGALQSVMQLAVDLGVNYIDTGASRVMFDESGACIGAETTDGKILTADRTILAAGAFVPFLLAESAPDRPEIHTGDRLVAVGAPMVAYTVPDNQMEKFKECPVMALIATLPGTIPMLAPQKINLGKEITDIHPI
jgi:sarcosine oxidase/L-pipecolate oxidase